MTLTNQAQLTFDVLAAGLTVGGNETVRVYINSVTDLYGYEFEVHYDPARVSATASFVNSFFDTENDAIVPPAYDAVCASGICKFAASKTNGGTASTGSGAVAEIVFTGSGAGDTSLTFEEDILSEEGAVAITHAKTTGFLTVFGSATVNGTVQLQGRPTPGDAGTVTVYDQFGYAPPTTVAFDTGTGAFSASVWLYTGSTNADVEASHSLYLTNRLTGLALTDGGTSNVGTTTLKGGDADNSGKVDLSDATCVGATFGGPPDTCAGQGSTDITNDGTVNIFDLVLVGGNYDLASPRPW
jgi:hypothetical protein